MAITRRFLLTSSLTGAGVLVLSACSDPSPAPSPSASPSVTPSRTPTATATTDTGVHPVASRRSQWGKDPYSYGSGSFLTTASTDSSRELLRQPLNDRLFFAGEAVASTDPGTLMGAYSSGLEVAAAVAATASKGERIAVVGAGLAGVTAARALADQGFDVVVVEARGRVGGRISPVTSSDWPIEIQLGVGTLYGDGAATLESVLTNGGVTVLGLDATEAARTSDAPTTPPDSASVVAALAAASAWAQQQSAEVTVDDAVTQSGSGGALSSVPDASGVSDTQRLAYLLDEALPARFGATAKTLSARALPVPLLPTDATLLTAGLGAYITGQLGKLDVLKSSNVTRITYANQGVGLRLVTGESLSADKVIVTVPLGVLQKKRIVFDPALPAATLAAIDDIGMGVQDVLWLRFGERLWSSDATVWAILDEKAVYRLWLNLEPSTGFPILVGLVGGDAARATEKLSDSGAVEAGLASLAPYLDMVPSTASPTPSPSGAAPSATPSP
ncbi:flavin monoamine oxidase family protein [Frondihabitans cladoniiphilus]|uniref:Amine oxidase domain-containing protein n=1 Tax=Frondihabitans cladoniiphilus TaxID=715785 RepID=A0ABP8W5N9_9MICO